MTSSSIVTVLDRPQNPANIGAVVRAMANLAYFDLRLGNPAPFERQELLRYAHRCDDLVAGLTIHSSLDDALTDAVYVVGTAAHPHPDRLHTYDIRGLAADLAARSRCGPVALLFGTEGDGLDRSALDRCHLIASVPMNPAYAALNLAQSVLLLLYEMRMAIGSPPPAPTGGETSDTPPARQAELARLFALTEELLHAVDYFRYSPETVMRDLRAIIYRSRLTSAEAAMLMGMVRKLLARTG